MFDSLIFKTKKAGKIRKIQFPNGTTHTIKIKEFAYSTKYKKYFISYYDKYKKKTSYKILNKINNNYYIDTNTNIEYKKLVKRYKKIKIKELPLVITYENNKKENNNTTEKNKTKKKIKDKISKIFDINKKQKNNYKNTTVIKEAKKVIDNIKSKFKNNTKKVAFDIYDVQNDLYIKKSLFDKFKIKDNDKRKRINPNNTIYIQVTKDEVNEICSKNKFIIPQYKKIKEKRKASPQKDINKNTTTTSKKNEKENKNKKENKRKATIKIYCINNKMYISEKLYNLFYKNDHIDTKTIKDKKYIPITEEQLTDMNEKLSILNYEVIIKKEYIVTNTTYRLKKDEIIQDLPFDSKDEQVFHTPGMTEEEIEKSKILIKSI